MRSARHIVYVTPTSEAYGGVRVLFQQAEGLRGRGYRVTVVGPGAAPDWYPLTVDYRQVQIQAPGAIPAADICIGTFWNTVEAAYRSEAAQVFHFCQGFEGVHPAYTPILDQIEAVYRLAMPRLLTSRHLEPFLARRYGCQCYFVGHAIEDSFFRPASFRPVARPLRVGVVGLYEVPTKGVADALRGLGLTRQAGYALEVHRAALGPQCAEEHALGVTDFYFHNLDRLGMVEFYHRLDAYIHPCHEEGESFPLPPFEAMACGLPVAVTDIAPFAVVPAEAALRFTPGNSDALLPVIVALSDPEHRRALRRAGLACAQTYTLDKVLDRLEAAFSAARQRDSKAANS